MDGYNAVMRIFKEKPEYISIVKKCVDAHHREKENQYSLGFKWSDVRVWAPKLALLATDYSFLKITFKSNSQTCYMVEDIRGAEQALRDIEEKRVAAPNSESTLVKVWLSPKTTQRLRSYLSRELPDKWDAESLVLERAVNLFLEKNDSQLTESKSARKPALPPSGWPICDSKRYEGKPYTYWWDVPPRKRGHLEKSGKIVFRKKDTGEECIVDSHCLLPLLTPERQTSRKSHPWGIRVLLERPYELAVEPGPMGQGGWAYICVDWTP